MRLSNLLAKTESALSPSCDRVIAGITADSRQIGANFLFAALPGVKNDGRAFIAEAIAKGAAAILVPEGTSLPEITGDTAVITAREPRLALSHIAAAFYPRQPQTLVAVTGTNGKTSTAQFTREIWSACGHAAASLGTLGIIAPGTAHEGAFTTPDPVMLHKTLDELETNGVTHLAMEASSHGLAQFRLDAVQVRAAGFTNLTRDHLDYHATMEAYAAAKTRLFTEVLQPDGVAVINADTPEAESLAAAARKTRRRVITYGEQGKDLRLLALHPQAQGQILRFDAFGATEEILIPIVGRFQVWNTLCALGMVLGAGEDQKKAIAALGQLTGVRGRVEQVGTLNNGASIFVDYAHTPDGLETVLKALRPHAEAHQGRLIVVFGCGGNRDKGKRPVMGDIAQRLANRVIVTDDNPRHEIPAEIRKDILAGCTPSPAITENGDRAAAIRQAIGELRAGDVLVIAGKGHESGQIVGDVTHPFDDAEITRAALREVAA